MVAAISRTFLVPDAGPELRSAVAKLAGALPAPAVARMEVDGRAYVVTCVDDALPLTPREEQLIELAAAGFEPKVIAYDLGLAPSTVRVLLARAGRKLGARTWRELVQIYIEAKRQRQRSGNPSSAPVPPR
jgi:DNA-binding NarL/FixJ family response regulator